MRNSANTVDVRWIEGLLCLAVILVTLALLTIPVYSLAFLPGVGVLFLLLLFRYPELGYYAIIFLIPFGAYRTLGGESGQFRIHWIIAFALLVFVFLRQTADKSALVNLRSPLWPLLLAYVPVSIVSAFLSPYRDVAFSSLLLTVVAFMFFALNLVFISRNGFSQTLPVVLIWSVSIGSSLAVLDYFFGVRFGGGGAATTTRAVGAATDPNQMSLMLIFVLPFLIYWAFFEGPRWRRPAGIALLVLNLAGLVSTESRGGSLALVVMLCGLMLEHRRFLKPKHLGLAICAAALVCVLVAALVPTTYWERQKTVTDPTDRSINRRTSYLVVGWDAFKNRPLLGSGPGTFTQIYAANPIALRFSRSSMNLTRSAHNTYLEVLISTGVLGLALFLGVLWRSLRDFTDAKRTVLRAGNETLAALIGTYRLSFVMLLLYLAMHSDFENKYLWLALAASQVAARIAREETAGVTQP